MRRRLTRHEWISYPSLTIALTKPFSGEPNAYPITPGSDTDACTAHPDPEVAVCVIAAFKGVPPAPMLLALAQATRAWPATCTANSAPAAALFLATPTTCLSGAEGKHAPTFWKLLSPPGVQTTLPRVCGPLAPLKIYLRVPPSLSPYTLMHVEFVLVAKICGPKLALSSAL